MKSIGKILKEHIESNRLVKKDIAQAAGISYNYLSTIFKQSTCDASLLERLYVAAGLNPGIVFDVPEEIVKTNSDNRAETIIGNASVQIGTADNLLRLLEEKERIIAEKERTIRILAKMAGVDVTGQTRDV